MVVHGAIERFTIEANELSFGALAAGPGGGRQVLLLHGFPQTAWSWHHQLEALSAAGMRALAFDQRGYSPGARPEGVDAYGVDHLVADALAVADAAGMERFDLVGHDWGGMLAWIVAARHPSRVRTLSVFSTPHPAAFGEALLGGDADQAARSSYIEVFREPGTAERALLGEDGSGDGLRAMFAASGLAGAEVEVFVDAMRDPGALAAALNWYRAMSPEDLVGMGPVVMPTLYVWSTEDVALGRRAAEGTAKWVEGPYRFEVLQGVSHWIPEMAPEESCRLLLDHLATSA